MNASKSLLIFLIFCLSAVFNVANAQLSSLIESLQQVANNLNANKNSGNNKVVVKNDSKKVIKTEKYKWKSGDKYDVGDMELKYFNDKTVLININTACGKNPHLCSVEDVMGTINNNIIEVDQKDDDGHVELKIKLMSNKAIVELRDGNFCGMAAYFDGEYVKVN